jgi:hypothetical protein
MPNFGKDEGKTAKKGNLPRHKQITTKNEISNAKPCLFGAF